MSGEQWRKYRLPAADGAVKSLHSLPRWQGIKGEDNCWKILILFTPPPSPIKGRECWPFYDFRATEARQPLLRGGERKLAVKPADRRFLNLSGPSEAHADLPGLHQDRHLPAPLGKPQHLLQGLGIFHHIPINDLYPFLGLGLPGLYGEGSALFAENGHLFGHLPPR